MGNCIAINLNFGDQALSRIFGFLRGKGYIRNLGENLNNLRNEMENLRATRREVWRRVAREEAQHRQRLVVVNLWLNRVDGKDKESEDLLRTSDAHLNELFLCDLCSINVCSSYRYGKRVFSLLEDIEKLKLEGKFIEVTEPAEVQTQHVVLNPQGCMIYAKAEKIKISHSEKPKNWTWRSMYEPQNEVAIEVAVLNEVYWLEIKGTFQTRRLTPETKYEVMFVVKLEGTASGWEHPVTLSLKLVMPDKSEKFLQEQTLCLDDYISDEWVDIRAGDFVAPPIGASATIFFTMYQKDSTVCKTGLVVKGVAIREP